MAEERRRQAQRDRDQLTPDEVDEIVQPGSATSLLPHSA
jgi:hypothetical protein